MRCCSRRRGIDEIRGSVRLFPLAVGFLCVAALALAPRADAARPLTTEDAAVPGSRQVEFELGWDAILRPEGGRDYVLRLTPIFGVGDRLQISADLPLGVHEPEGGVASVGLADIVFGCKALLMKGRAKRPAIAAVFGIKSATGDDAHGLGVPGVHGTATLVATAVLRSVALHVMILHLFTGGQRGDALSLGVGSEMPLTSRLGLAAEIQANRCENRAHPAAALTGFTFLVARGVTLDASTRIGLDSTEPRWGFAAGLSLASP